MEAHLQRVVEEKRELDEKLSKLSAFFGTDTFAGLVDEQKELLRRQAYHMQCYSNILASRLL